MSCNKKKDSLIGISISPNTMIGTPAEMFSLQQIKMFQASNSFIVQLMNEFPSQMYTKNIFIAPMYILNGIMLDSILTDWHHGFSKHYDISELSYQQKLNSANTFIKTVHDIDSSLNINNTIDSLNGRNMLCFTQALDLKLMYTDSEPDDVDNIFTTIDNKKPRLDFITINNNPRVLISEEEQVTEIPVGNGNYMLMFIKPIGKSIAQYVRTFSEKKYFKLITDMQERKINVSFPLFDIADSILNLTMPAYTDEDTVHTFSKQLNVYYKFTLHRADMTEIADKVTPGVGKEIRTSNDTKPIRYSSPFMYILRGKNSNLIMAVGFYTGPQS